MPGPDIDYTAVFQAVPSPMLVMTRGLVMVDANEAYLKVSGRSREELIGRNVFDVFPDNPADPGASGTRNLRASLERVLATGLRDSMALQKYDVENPDRPGAFEERYWSPVNSPVIGPDGQVTLIVHRVEEVTALVRQLKSHHPWERPGQALTHEEQMAADLLTRAEELQELNQQLRAAHARERRVALTLQQAMLPSIPEARRTTAAVRYRPATGALNVCGDWYDLHDLTPDLTAVAVGDVVGHGLEAAGVMGQLHAALSAAVRATRSPARALETLDQYAATIDGAMTTTAAQTLVDRTRLTVSYSSAGHPPPILVHPDGTAHALDAATDPPLGTLSEPPARPEAVAAYSPGSILTLYTDGLIERRGEDIDTGLRRLTDSLVRHRRLTPEQIADAVLADLGAAGGNGRDDTALVVVRL
ncbi:PAS domain S-box protein [Streptomyces sp. CB01881]|uniref:SpoIIE family protein phosphatase n=1 Tax=Streptomyces sp. CB01881 TaxID=2078691 RepID=UPI0011E02B5D|nr:SpoIIE family protein phosphatase [Streptomyces sp. CB01881]TYC66721.1 PAS domain S-box protein [Streptomyces sp. CB01881]